MTIKLLRSSNPTCRMSDPAQPHKLCRRRSDPPLSMCFSCKGTHLEDLKYYYYCATCNLEFHRGCHLVPGQIKHPFHPSHTLTLVFVDSDCKLDEIPNLLIGADSPDSDDDDDDDDTTRKQKYFNRLYGQKIVEKRGFRPIRNHDDIDDGGNHTRSDEKCESCTCCRRRLEAIYYQCSVCNFKLNYSCSGNTVPFTITHLKMHAHTLTLFPKRISYPCDACGFFLEDTRDFVYACIPCGYMTHRSCADVPRVIKITRHQHRLSHTSSLPSGDFSCGVCRHIVDVNYGQYSCNKGCLYAVHSKCATRNDVWDGKDLEGVPEEDDEDGDIEPFVCIDEETIKHFSHDHNLRLYQNDSSLHDGGIKFCEACCVPVIPSKVFYSCMQCNFVLDEACACLPRKKHHPLHKHPLTLYPDHSDIYQFWYGPFIRGGFVCSSFYCQMNCGFVYKCDEKGCKYILDVRCASLPDPLIHESHPRDHPLFFNLTRGRCMVCEYEDGCSDDNYLQCRTCMGGEEDEDGDSCSKDYLECMICKSFLGLECATLPPVAHYKHDRHPLTLNYGEKGTTDLNYWCEICESKIDVSKRFYACDPCGVTLHVRCLFWKREYAKPNHTIKVFDRKEVQIVRNGGNSRPVCDRCELRCAGTLVFKWLDRVFCSFSCARRPLTFS